MIQVYLRTSSFTREHKYTTGERLKNEMMDLLINIYWANKAKKDDRIVFIEKARHNVESIRLLLRVCKDLKVIGMKGFVSMNVQVEELSKQLVAWGKYTAGAHANE